MKNGEGTPKTAHTTNKVPFVMANAPDGWSLKKKDGVLGDVAPTILAAMGLEQPEEMSGTSLLIVSLLLPLSAKHTAHLSTEEVGST
jgi:2,3-bisphosphoglycerate-independent phosphoglycerate mutase